MRDRICFIVERWQFNFAQVVNSDPIGGNRLHMAAQTAADFVPDSHDLDTLSEAATGCKGCDLYLNANQTVFGAGAQNADMMLVGEQPGDQEDKAGAPFVGPAGKLLDKALVAAGVDRDRLYVTNAVKHFKFTLPERGKRRIHKTPSRTEVVACRPWLLAEMMSVQAGRGRAARCDRGTVVDGQHISAHRASWRGAASSRHGEMTNLDIDPDVVVIRASVVGAARPLAGPRQGVRRAGIGSAVRRLTAGVLDRMNGSRPTRRWTGSSTRWVASQNPTGQQYSDSNFRIERSISPFTALAAAIPIGPNSGLPPRSMLTVKEQPDFVGATDILSAYLVPPTPSPVIPRSRGGSSSRTVHLTRLRIPLAPATPTSVVPTVSSDGTSPRQPSCIWSQSPSSDRLDACSHASSGLSDRSRESSNLATREW